MRKLIITIVLILSILCTVCDGMIILGFTRAVQYTWNLGFFLILLPGCIALWDWKRSKELL